MGQAGLTPRNFGADAAMSCLRDGYALASGRSESVAASVAQTGQVGARPSPSSEEPSG